MPGPPRRKPWTYGGPRRRRNPPMPHDHGGRCAVIVSAYQAQRWIEDCIGSIRAQVSRSGWEYELRVGTDGCELTSELLTELGVTHWHSPKNVGPYIMRNSLIGLLRADAYAIFDADDIMYEDYLYTLLARTGAYGIAGAGRHTVDESGRKILKRVGRFYGGVCVISHNAWVKLGGYRPWPVAADDDLVSRARALRIPVFTESDPMYKRRRHDASLTRDPKTGLKSDLRRTFHQRSKKLIRQGALQCSRTVTTPLTLVEAEETS